MSVTPRPWMSTSSGCARRWRSIRATRGTSSRCAVSATSSSRSADVLSPSGARLGGVRGEGGPLWPGPAMKWQRASGWLRPPGRLSPWESLWAWLWAWLSGSPARERTSRSSPAIMGGGQVEAVLTLGTAAAEAWQFWKATPNGRASSVAFAPVIHPTEPESSSKNDKTKKAQATKKMLANWNVALQALSPAITHPDVPVPLKLYGDAWADGDRLPMPESDFPAGLPTWMHEQDGWATRTGKDALSKRRNITINVPKGTIP